MADEISGLANVVYADGPMGAPTQPPKPDIRTLFGVVQAQVDAAKGLAAVATQWKEPVALATTVAVSPSGEMVIDGVMTNGTRVLVKNQGSQQTNGIYITAPGPWTRATDADTAAEVLGMAVYVTGGTSNGGRQFICTATGPITLGTTALPFIEISNNNVNSGRSVTGGGISTGGGPLNVDRVITTPAATTTSALDKSNNIHAMTPRRADEKIANSFGDLFTDERFGKVLWADANGAPLFALEHDGTIYNRSSNLVTDEYWAWAITDTNGVVLLGLTWDNQFFVGPVYDSSITLANALAYIEGGNAFVATDKRAQLTFGEVSPFAAGVQGTDAIYKTSAGSVVTTTREDLLAINSLAAGTTRVRMRILYGQSLGSGGAAVPALTLVPPSPGRLVMPNGGIRALGTSQDGNYANTPLPRENIKSWVDAAERTDGNAGETPGCGLGVRLSAFYPTNEALLVVSHAIGGQRYEFIKKSTVPYANMMLDIRRAWIMCQLLGLELDVAVHFIHGEADVDSAAGVYRGYLAELQANIETDVKAIVPGHGDMTLYVSQMANFTAYNKAFSYVPDEQAAAARANPTKIRLTGSRYQYPTESDGIHLVNTASYGLGVQHGSAEIRKQYFYASSASRSGNTITVTCVVPTGPIVRDTAVVTDPGPELAAAGLAGTKYGFRYVQTGGTARTITDVTTDGTTITVTLSGNPGSPSAESLYIGMDGVSGNAGGPTTGPRTCFRDTSGGSHLYGNRLNWLSARILPIT